MAGTLIDSIGPFGYIVAQVIVHEFSIRPNVSNALEAHTVRKAKGDRTSELRHDSLSQVKRSLKTAVIRRCNGDDALGEQNLIQGSWL
jgi:hypothetical protein